MQITTSKGKTFDIQFIGSPLRNSNKLMIELEDERLISEISADFEGLSTIEMTENNLPNVKHIYEGFTKLAGIQENEETGTYRLTLKKGDAA